MIVAWLISRFSIVYDRDHVAGVVVLFRDFIRKGRLFVHRENGASARHSFT